MDPVPRRPRNARLTAYYGLKKSPEPPATDSSPLPAESKDVSWAAPELIKRLPLEKLVRTSTMIRDDAERVERTLHDSVRNCYEQVTAAASECASLRDVCRALGSDSDGTLSRIARACDQCRTISDEMAPMRDQIENLEESRRVMLLLRAAELLAKQLPAQLTELTELCTDPQSARDRLFLTAHRCAVIMPQLAALGNDAACFKEAHATLDIAISGVVADLYSQVEDEQGAIEGLSLADLMRIRVFLLVEDNELRSFFLNTATAVLRSRTPEQGYQRISRRSGLSRAAFKLRYSANVMLDDIKAISSAYDAVFRGPSCFVAHAKKRSGEVYTDDSVLSAEDFVAWMAGTIDDLIGADVRKEVKVAGGLNDGENYEGVSMEDLRDFKDVVCVLRKNAESDGAVDPDTSLAQVPIVIETLCDSICAHVEETITGQAISQMSGLLEHALFSDFVADDGRAIEKLQTVVVKIQELSENCDLLLRQLVSTSEDEAAASNMKPSLTRSFQVEILRLLLNKIDVEGEGKMRDEKYDRAVLRVAFVCEEVAVVSSDRLLMKSLRSIAEDLRCDFTTRIVDFASNSFRYFLFPSSSNNLADAFADATSISNEIVSLLHRARKEVDLYPSAGSALHEDWRLVPGDSGPDSGMDLYATEVLDSNGVVHRIAENWTQWVRMSSLSREKKAAVDSIILKISQSLGNADFLSDVSKAANERCNEL